ncbi:MAG: VWA domain-containing protein [Bacteroidetes bacterium]|nr:VWA domain-containing protein [Bacteroidota bacterium]
MNKQNYNPQNHRIWGGFCLFFILILQLCFSANTYSQTKKKTRILFVLDCSASMWGPMTRTTTRMDVAKGILTQLVDSLSKVPDLEIALRTYGLRAKRGVKDCKDTKLEVGFDIDNVAMIKKKIKEAKPNGSTPIAYSLSKCGEDFPDNKSKNNIILITDGYEECDGDPCAVSAALQSRGIILRPFIVGLGMSDSLLQQFECVGRFAGAKTAEDFRKALNHAVSEVINVTSVTVNLNDVNGKPTETDVNMSFIDVANKTVSANFYQTLNKLGKPDTFMLNPTIRYDLQINTTPPINKKGVEVKRGEHNIIEVDAPQGSLQLNHKTWDKFQWVQCLVRKAGGAEVIFVQDVNSTHKYLQGSYDLEVLTLPRVKMKGVRITGSQELPINIPQAGRLEVSYAKDMIATIISVNGKSEEWVIDLRGGTQPKLLEFIYLQPGTYKIIYRPFDAKNTMDTKQQEVVIQSAKINSITLK